VLIFLLNVTRLLHCVAEARSAGVPLVLGLLVTLLSGIVLLLAHKFTLAAILGYSVASMLIVVSGQTGRRRYMSALIE
jgi:hypothetical protein